MLRLKVYVNWVLMFVYSTGDVMFNVQSPLSAPDVIFAPDDENFPPFLLSCGGDHTKSPLHILNNWNSRDPSRLLSFILQLRLNSAASRCSIFLSYLRDLEFVIEKAF